MNILKRMENYITAFFKLGRIERMAKRAKRGIDEQAVRIDNIEKRIDDGARKLRNIQEVERAYIDARLTEHTQYDNELSRRLDRLMVFHNDQGNATPKDIKDEPPNYFGGTEVFLDVFYNRLENRLRGSPEEIFERMRIYQPDIEAAVIRTEGKPALDLGCGRGEWLHLMSTLDVSAYGVDLNSVQISEAKDANLDVRQQDACAALRAAEDSSLSIVSAHHLIEHISFRDVAFITLEAMRVLAPGGILLFETPNPRNVLVGATSFYNDPTHLRPLTEPVLATLLETAGYYPVESRFLHPHERLDEFLARPGIDSELAYLLFGPQDLALIGQKPRKEA